jgi:hypothetical protein
MHVIPLETVKNCDRLKNQLSNRPRNGEQMKKSWPKQNINMNTLTQQLIQFFESRKFEEVTALKTEAGYQIIAGSSPHYKMNTDVSATIEERQKIQPPNNTDIYVRRRILFAQASQI